MYIFARVKRKFDYEFFMNGGLSVRIYQTIAQICTEQGRSVSSVEREARFSAGTLRRWDSVVPGIDKLMKIADILGVSVDRLCGRDDFDDEDDTGDSALVRGFISEIKQQSELNPDEEMLLQAYRLIPASHRIEAMQAVLGIMQKYEN